jgi:hypothetical protein
MPPPFPILAKEPPMNRIVLLRAAMSAGAHADPCTVLAVPGDIDADTATTLVRNSVARELEDGEEAPVYTPAPQPEPEPDAEAAAATSE